ncbi:immunity protein YezG family protein [Bacillus cereus group sp. BfR-BA-01383]|uniref:immunity protein YezG family protein n=1 Tax=Bacillus cereus group sp. BfR-BA-01383 TaxID=2920327 RepID=UPI001F5A1F2C|nr:immunity protein YezG family protein [Bacillus cereus group sp. BfR-BA-01383]
MKEFEEKFSELQSDMISICMEYVEDRADKVYVYASCEEGIISGRFFYLINNIHVKCHKVNDALGDRDERYDVSRERQFMVLRIICEDIEKVKALCKEYERDMPTEMKLIYDAHSGKFKAQYKYDLVYTNDDVKTASHIADEWFEEVKNNNL